MKTIGSSLTRQNKREKFHFRFFFQRKIRRVRKLAYLMIEVILSVTLCSLYINVERNIAFDLHFRLFILILMRTNQRNIGLEI